jgi:hypothetical protein
MTGQICIKTPSGMSCSASPITEYGNAQFTDPYKKLKLSGDRDDSGVLIKLLSAVIEHRKETLRGKGAAVLTTVELMLLDQVPADQPFVVLGLDGMEKHGKNRMEKHGKKTTGTN